MSKFQPAKNVDPEYELTRTAGCTEGLGRGVVEALAVLVVEALVVVLTCTATAVLGGFVVVVEVEVVRGRQVLVTVRVGETVIVLVTKLADPVTVAVTVTVLTRVVVIR